MMSTFKLKLKRGIHDLQSPYCFLGASQGDETRTNSVEEYKASQGWLIPVFKGIDIYNQEEVDREANRRIKENAEYIERLHKEGRFEEEYEETIEFMSNPSLDDTSNLVLPVESYKVVILDITEEDGKERPNS